jgi:hypothetical protein
MSIFKSLRSIAESLAEISRVLRDVRGDLVDIRSELSRQDRVVPRLTIAESAAASGVKIHTDPKTGAVTLPEGMKWKPLPPSTDGCISEAAPMWPLVAMFAFLFVLFGVLGIVVFAEVMK